VPSHVALSILFPSYIRKTLTSMVLELSSICTESKPNRGGSIVCPDSPRTGASLSDFYLTYGHQFLLSTPADILPSDSGATPPDLSGSTETVIQTIQLQIFFLVQGPATSVPVHPRTELSHLPDHHPAFQLSEFVSLVYHGMYCSEHEG
jgi:hypothetical protein